MRTERDRGHISGVPSNKERATESPKQKLLGQIDTALNARILPELFVNLHRIDLNVLGHQFNENQLKEVSKLLSEAKTEANLTVGLSREDQVKQLEKTKGIIKNLRTHIA